MYDSLHIYFFLYLQHHRLMQCYHDICQISFMKNVIRIFCHVYHIWHGFKYCIELPYRYSILLVEHFVGGVSVAYVFAGFWCYISLVLVFYSMIYLSICKDYQRIAQYYGAGMLLAVFLVTIFALCFTLGYYTKYACRNGCRFFLDSSA